MKKALITGVTGQDGSYLAELLLQKGYQVHGIVRKSSTFSTKRIDHLIQSEAFGSEFFYHWGDVSDASSLSAIMQKVQPDEVYNLAAQSHVKVSFDVPEYTAEVDALGALRVIEAARTFCPGAKVYQASTSEMYGGMKEHMPEKGFNEHSFMQPKSPYAAAKLYAYWVTRTYREAYQMFLCNGILFNHESPRRGETFVTRKITRWCGENKQRLLGKDPGPINPLQLGNLSAVRDWSHAKDAVFAQWLILQQEKPDDYVVATGDTATVREFVSACFSWLGVPLYWEGVGVQEKALAKIDGEQKTVVVVNPKYFRPAEVEFLQGDSTKIRSLGWKPKYSFTDLVDDMMKHDCSISTKGALYG